MEPEQQDPQHQIQPQLQLLQQQQSGNGGGGGGGGGVVVEIADGSSSGGGGGNKSSFLCRQSSTRWTPTTDQIRILKDLYYNNGVRSPTGEQIQRISARLRQYGKIEGKNVFYWFQNHKARERQKKRFTVDMAAASMLQQQQQQQLRPSSISISAPSASCSTGGAGSGGAGACGGGGGWKQYQNSDHYQDQYTFNTKYQNITQTGVLSCPSSPGSSQGIMNVNAQTGSISTTSSYGSMLMEKSFRDCSISSGGCSNLIGVPTLNNNNNLGWIGTTHHEHHNQYPCPSSSSSSSSYYPNFVETNKTTPIIQQLFKETSVHEVETLPLFPMNDKDENVTGFFAGLSNPNPSIGYTHYPGVEEDRARTTTTSLELTLSSSSYISPNPN